MTVLKATDVLTPILPQMHRATATTPGLEQGRFMVAKSDVRYDVVVTFRG